MATYFARATGNVNGAIWATTPTGTAATQTFTSADVLVTQSGFTVTLNVSVTVAQLRNDGFGSSTAGGGFTLNNGVTLAADLIGGAASLLTFSPALGNSATINGNVTASGAGQCVTFTSPASAATLNINGSVTSTVGYGVYFNNPGTLNITGNCTAVAQAAVYCVNSTGTLNITGDLQASASAPGIAYFGNATTVNITGRAIAASSGTQSAVGTAFSGHVISVTGTAIGGGGTGVGVAVNNTGCTVTVTRAKGGSVSPGVAGSTFGCVVREIEYGDTGSTPTSGLIYMDDNSSNVALFYKNGGGGTKKTLIDGASTLGYPATSDVRSGTVFANGNRTGTCAVPGASSVAAGVLVDATTGTAVITSAAVQSAVDAALTAWQSGRLTTVATVATTGQQINDATW